MPRLLVAVPGAEVFLENKDQQFELREQAARQLQTRERGLSLVHRGGHRPVWPSFACCKPLG